MLAYRSASWKLEAGKENKISSKSEILACSKLIALRKASRCASRLPQSIKLRNVPRNSSPTPTYIICFSYRKFSTQLKETHDLCVLPYSHKKDYATLSFRNSTPGAKLSGLKSSWSYPRLFQHMRVFKFIDSLALAMNSSRSLCLKCTLTIYMPSTFLCYFIIPPSRAICIDGKNHMTLLHVAGFRRNVQIRPATIGKIIDSAVT